MCFSPRCYCGTRAESRRNHGGVTADVEIPLSYHCGLMRGHGDHFRQDCGVGCSTAGPVRGHFRAGGATVGLPGWRCGSRAAPWRPILDVVFGRITVFAAAEDVATVITVITYYYCFNHLVMPPKRAIARRLYCGGKAVMEGLLLSLYCAVAVMAVPRRCRGGAAVIMAVPQRSHCGLAQPAVTLRKF